MVRALALAASGMLLCSLAVGQEAGYRDLSFPNTTGQGSSTLSARVYYPATAAGANTPMVTPPAGGYPLGVFLHGWLQQGTSYPKLGNFLAKKGYVAVLNNTGQFSSSVQGNDAKAYYPALSVASTQPGNFLQGAIDMNRAALSGHSMGGGNTIEVLANNPGFRCGFVFAPIYPGASTTAQVDVPLGVIHGEGDFVLIWSLTGLNVYNQATGVTGLRTFYRMDFSCGHNNLTSLIQLTSTDQEVWRARCRRSPGRGRARRAAAVRALPLGRDPDALDRGRPVARAGDHAARRVGAGAGRGGCVGRPGGAAADSVRRARAGPGIAADDLGEPGRRRPLLVPEPDDPG